MKLCTRCNTFKAKAAGLCDTCRADYRISGPQPLAIDGRGNLIDPRKGASYSFPARQVTF